MQILIESTFLKVISTFSQLSIFANLYQSQIIINALLVSYCFNFYPPIPCEVKNIFIYLLDIWFSFSVSFLYISFAHLLPCRIVFHSYLFQGALCIIGTVTVVCVDT